MHALFRGREGCGLGAWSLAERARLVCGVLNFSTASDLASYHGNIFNNNDASHGSSSLSDVQDSSGVPPRTPLPQTLRISKDHPESNIIGDPHEGIRTRRQLVCGVACYVSMLEPKNVDEALQDDY